MKWGLALLATALVAATLLLAASGPATTTRAASDPFRVGCYDTLDAAADVSVVAFKGHDATSAEALCAHEWSVQGHAGHDDVVTCVVPAGGLGVFPDPSRLGAAEACASMGASLPDDGPVYRGLTAEAVRALDRTLAARYEATWPPGATCGDAGVLHVLAYEVLAEHDASMWTVADETSGPGDCGHPRVDAPAATIVLEGG